MEPETSYAKSGDVHIAYQVVGDGPVALLFVNSYASSPTLDSWWEEPIIRRGVERLASFSRLILVDLRGSGLSDRMFPQPSSLEDGAEDLLAVMDQVGTERAALLGCTYSGLPLILFTAAHPDRSASLILYACHATSSWHPDYPWGVKREERAAFMERSMSLFGTGSDIKLFAPSEARNDRFRQWWVRRQRSFGGPGGIPIFTKLLEDVDLRPLLPTIRVPTLILHRRDARIAPVGHSRYLAEHIPGAKYVELEGADTMPFVGDFDAIADEIEEFLTGARRGPEPDRVLATILFTDVVASTERAAQLGDHQWRRLLDDHHALVRGELKRYRGREIDTAGDGFLATFDGPARAIRCASAIRDAVTSLGLEIRAGVHTGEIELRGEDVAGIAVHIAARISAMADPGEVLVSSTVRDLVVGSEIELTDRGAQVLRGVPGEWRLFRVQGARS